jgi:probable rRNA maturation factor
MQLAVDVADEQTLMPIDVGSLAAAARTVLEGEGIERATLSIAVVDDARMRELHARYLGHDEPTDVLSFPLGSSDECLEGEVVVSAETAARRAPDFGWTAAEEIVLYVIHGTLHLAGYDDHTDDDRRAMRERERHYLERLGLSPRE